jgi:uncharacterized membrane protein YphA (DoxX/SURF4 family)
MNATTISTSRSTTIFIWILRILMAAVFLPAAVMKLTSAPMLVSEFDLVGLGQWFRYLTGLIELAGGILVLLPAVSVYGAMFLLMVDVGAFVAQVSRIHMDWIHTIVIGALLGTLIYLQRGRLTGRG